MAGLQFDWIEFYQANKYAVIHMYLEGKGTQQ